MIERPLFILIISFTSFIFFSCESNKEEKNAAKVQNESAVEQNSEIAKNDSSDKDVEKAGIESAKLAYKFKAGETFGYNLRMISQNNQTIIADSVAASNLEETVDYYFEITVNSIDKQQIADLTINVKKITLHSIINGQQIYYSTDSMLPEESRKQFLEFEALHNKPYRIKISNTGEISNVYSVDAISDFILKEQGLIDSLSTIENLKFSQNVIDGMIQPLTQQLFRVLSGRDMKIGDAWENNYQSTVAVFQVENIARFTVRNFIKNDELIIAEIDADLEIDYTGENRVSENGFIYSFDEPNVSGRGQILFDVTNGLLYESETETSMQINFSVEGIASNQVKQNVKREEIVVNKNIIRRMNPNSF